MVFAKKHGSAMVFFGREVLHLISNRKPPPGRHLELLGSHRSVKNHRQKNKAGRLDSQSKRVTAMK